MALCVGSSRRPHLSALSSIGVWRRETALCAAVQRVRQYFHYRCPIIDVCQIIIPPATTNYSSNREAPHLYNLNPLAYNNLDHPAYHNLNPPAYNNSIRMTAAYPHPMSPLYSVPSPHLHSAATLVPPLMPPGIVTFVTLAPAVL